MSSFSGINAAARALAAQQKAMQITGQNLANANTPGYSRQRVDLAESAISNDGFNAQRFVPGDGVDVVGITRINDAFADAAQRQASANNSYQQATAQVWNHVEVSLNEPGVNGLNKAMTDFAESWGDLNNSDSNAVKQQVLEDGKTVGSMLNQLDNAIAVQWSDQLDNTKSIVEDVNASATRVAELNASIQYTLAAGASANELMDQRSLELKHLSELTGARVVPGRANTVDVYVGNGAIVTGLTANAVSLNVPSTVDKLRAVTATTQISLMVGSQGVTPADGNLKAGLDALNTTLPGVRDKFDSVAASVADTVNSLYGQGRTPVPTFFDSGSTAAVTALNIKLTPATGSDVLVGLPTAGTRDTSYAAKLSALASVPNSPVTTWRNAVANIGTSSKSASSRADLAATVSLQADASREAASGVNIDEEMTNLVAFQHAYQGAARVLTAMDQALDTLINRTGLVGR